jgi:hypothetical protein
VIVPNVELPPAIPFTLQVTAVFVELATVAVKACGSPSSTDAEVGETLTATLGGGGCDGPEPASPLQPRNEEARNNAGHN